MPGLAPEHRVKVARSQPQAWTNGAHIGPVENFADWALLEGKDYYHSPDGKINAQALQNNINSLKELGLLKETLNVAPHVDNSLLDEAAKRL